MRHRRFPYRERADVAVLDALGPEQAQAFDRLLQEEARSERRFRGVSILESDLQPGGLERARARGRHGDGAGGGRRRGRAPLPDA
jgi:hypothetical protein